ncbi:MAG: hypothetical protein AAGI63_08625 [Planctomycetota bacterium]
MTIRARARKWFLRRVKKPKRTLPRSTKQTPLERRLTVTSCFAPDATTVAMDARPTAMDVIRVQQTAMDVRPAAMTVAAAIADAMTVKPCPEKSPNESAAADATVVDPN